MCEGTGEGVGEVLVCVGGCCEVRRVVRGTSLCVEGLMRYSWVPNRRGEPVSRFLTFLAVLRPFLCFLGGFSRKSHCHPIIPPSNWHPRVLRPEYSILNSNLSNLLG